MGAPCRCGALGGLSTKAKADPWSTSLNVSVCAGDWATAEPDAASSTPTAAAVARSVRDMGDPLVLDGSRPVRRGSSDATPGGTRRARRSCVT